MPPSTVPAGAFSRRTLLAGAGILALAAGCTSKEDKRPAVSPQQADRLTAQVTVQEALVAAYAAAGTADPALAPDIADLAGQAKEQLDRLKAAAPTASTSTAKSASASSGAAAPAPPPGSDARAWLRQQVAAAATSHAGACLDQSGARAALLGSIAAGLRGQDVRLG